MKKKVLVLLLIIAIVCSLFAFVACNDPNGNTQGGDDSNQGEIGGGEQNQPDDNKPGGDNNQSGDGDNKQDDTTAVELKPANQNYKGEEIDYSLYFETDGNGKIVALSDYAIEERESIIQLEIPEKIGNEDITALNIDIIDDIPFLRVLVIPENIVKVHKNDIIAIPYAVLYCEAESKPSDWDEDWNIFDDCMIEQIPVVWNCNNNDVADDGNMYGISSEGALFALKDGKAEMMFSGRCEDENIILKSNYKYKDSQYRLKNIMAYSYIAVWGSDEVFQNCKNVKSITLPDSLETIGVAAFANCQVQEIVFPKSLKHIGDYGLGFSGITKAILPEGLLSIGEGAFAECENLVDVVLPNSIVEFPLDAFFRCDKLRYNELENGLYLGNSDNPRMVLSGVKNKEISTFEINEKTKLILDGAFMDCVNLESIEIPNNIRGIGNQVFKNCSNLKEVKFASECKIDRIGEKFFYGCSNLREIEIPNTVKEIEESAFYECTNLINIEIPSSVISIAENAFYGCQGLESVTFGENSQLSKIANYAFHSCSSLDGISIPSTVTSIGDAAFAMCSNLQSVNFGKNSQLTSIGNMAFGLCESLNSIVIPASVSKVGEYAFLFGSADTTIYCEAESQPSGWNENWTALNEVTVIWGYNKSE